MRNWRLTYLILMNGRRNYDKDVIFYDGTLDRAKAREVVETSEKPLMFRYGFAYRGAEKRPITKEKALSIIDDSGNYLDITETDNEILLNTFSSNDMW